MSEYQLFIRDTYSDIIDTELDAIVSETQMQHPSWGNRQMYGYQLSHDIRVQFQRVR